MSETGYSSEESLNHPKELWQEIAVATVTQDPFGQYQADENAYSSDEGFSSKEQTLDVTINPESCRPEGGKCSWLEFDKSLPSSVTSAWAAFEPYDRVKIRTYDEDCTMFGKKIPRPFHQEKQLEAEKFLKALVYAAAEAGAMRLIETIFSLPAGRVVFQSYKEESVLPEDIAEENGHGKAAAYLRGKTKRYSEEQSMIPVQSRTIEFDWLKLANALEKLELSQSGKLRILISFFEKDYH